MTITNGYLTLAEAQEYLGKADPFDTATLEDAVTAASRAIDQHCQRCFWQTSAGTARRFDSCDGVTVTFGPFCDLVTATAVASDDNDDGTFETTITSYELLPRTPGPESKPYTELRLLGGSTFPLPTTTSRTGRVQVTGTWGWPAVPAPVKQAARLLTHRIYKRQDSPLGVLGGAEFGVAYVRRLDPDVEALLAPYRHGAGFGFA